MARKNGKVKKRVAIITINLSFGNCVGLYKALSEEYDVTVFTRSRDQKGMVKEIPHHLGFSGINLGFDHYFIVSAAAFLRVHKSRIKSIFRYKRKISVILTDSCYRVHHEYLNKLIHRYRLFVMPDLSYLCPFPHKIYYAPFEYIDSVNKNESITIAHSPHSASKRAIKGTEIIKQEVAKYNVNFSIIEGKSWREAIAEKSKAHIFIDQIAPNNGDGWHGGLGKSGIEAMAVGCATITSGDCFNHNGEIPPPPIVLADENTLYDVVGELLENTKHREEIATNQQLWVQAYLNYKFQSNYLHV